MTELLFAGVRTVSRRKFLLGGSLAAAGSAAAQCLLADVRGPAPAAAAEYEHGSHHLITRGTGHLGMVGRVNPAVNGFDPRAIVRDFDWGKSRRTAAGRT